MLSTPETLGEVLSGIEADPRLPAQIDKCRAYFMLTGFTHVISKSAYVHAGKLGCEAYPAADFPWDK